MADTPPNDIMSSISSSTAGSTDDEVMLGISDEFLSESSLSDYVLLPRTLREAPFPHTESDDSASETESSLPFDSLSITTSSKADDELDANEIAQPLQKPWRKAKPTSVESQDTNPPSRSASPVSDSGAVTPTSSYENAVAFITKHLDSPCRTSGTLQLLQAFIIELGLSKEVPTTITSAKKLLKAEAHVNINDYVDVRGKDQETLRKILHPNKSALRKSIRQHRKPVKWVKEHGLAVFLIGFRN